METTGQTLDIAWILVCAALVMLMQAGFSCLESGLVRTKNSINVAAKNFADFCLSSVVFWLFGFALMFGVTAGGLFGTSGFFFGETATPWLFAFFIFQLGFCGTATTIVSGAVSERMRFAGYLVVATIVSAVIYPVIGHWVWGSAAGAAPGGWLEQMGFIDFAGSTVVHSVGGWISLAAIIIIGPRIGRFGKNAVPIHGHDLPFVTLGVFLLWFGWFGFNGGSTLGLTPAVPTIIVNTTISGAFGGMVAMAVAWRLSGRPDVTMIMNGSLAGLVGITASAHIMTPLAAAGIGSIAAVFMYVVTWLLERFEIDDVVGAVPVHLAAGIWGTLAVAIFSDPQNWGSGLGRWDQFVVQATGVGATFVWAFGIGFTLLWLINRRFPLRIDPEGERIGLNVVEHGASTEILDLLTEMDDQRRAGDFSQPVSVEPHTEVGQIAQQYNRVLADINAEQRQREAVTEALRQQTASLQLLRETAAAANRAKSIEEAVHTCLDGICDFGGWPIGHCFLIDDAVKKLISTRIWHLDDEERYAVFREVTEKLDIGPGGGLITRMLASGEPIWFADVTKEKNFLRARVAKDVGIKGAAAFPVLVGEDVVAVLEFFSPEPLEPNEAVLEVMASVGAQLGRVVERARSAEARFKTMVDNMPANVHLRDKDGRFILVNRKYEEFYGVTNDSVRGKTLHEVEGNTAFDQMVAEGEAADREVIEKNTIIEREYRAMSDGGYRTLTDRMFPITDSSGEAIEVGGVEIDITELKRTEEALAEKSAILEATMEHMDQGISMFESDLKLTAFNSEFVKLLEFPADLVHTGISLAELFRYNAERGEYGPGDPDEQVAERIALARKFEAHHFERTRPDGMVIEIRGKPTTGGGMVTTYADISERKRAEKKLAESQEHSQALADYMQVALSSMSDGIYILDGDLNIFAFNQRYVDLLNFPEGLVREGGSIANITKFAAKRGDYGSQFDGDIDDIVAGRLKQIKSSEEFSIENITPTGRIIEYRSSPIKGGGFVSIMHDITERKQAAEALENAHEIIKDQKERMEDELNVGREIQMSMVPLVFPPFPDHDEFSIFATLQPAREVGGDFYDFYFIDDAHLCFCIGDVSGKGVPSALFMAMAKTLIKSRAADDQSTASILTHVNDELSMDNESNMFVTIFVGILNIESGELTYTNAGHNPPHLKRARGALQRLDQRHGPIIGAIKGMVYKEQKETLKPGDLLLLYTDGVTEAMDDNDQLFSEERLKELLALRDANNVEKVVDDTVSAVRAFEGKREQADDITLLALRFHNGREDALIAEQRITIKNELPEIAVVNAQFEAFAEEIGIPLPIATKFNLVFDELLNNVISYAYTDAGEHDIEVKMARAGERLTVTITDDGIPFNPLSVETPNIDLPLEERDVGGLGVHLVRNLMDTVSYQRRIDKNVVTLMRNLQQEGDAP